MTDRKEMYEIIEKADYCHMAVCRDHSPYVIPMNYGFSGGKIYLHSANQGLKIDILKENPYVCISIMQGAELKKSSSPCKYSMRYQSILIYGKAQFLAEGDKKREALKQIILHHDRDTGQDQWDLNHDSPDFLTIIQVEIEKITGKKSA